MASGGSTASALATAVRAGDLSALEAVEHQLAALHAAHEATNAVRWFDDERARADASELDRRMRVDHVAGPLQGVAITVKDWIDVEGFPCSGAWATEHRDRRPSRDATAVARLRAAGAVVMAKTRPAGGETTSERVDHPIRPERTVGGSSSGEAAAVGYGGSLLGIGSDSGGSIRLPAAWCGVIGLKPTAGLVPTTGHFPRVGALSDGRTQIGPFARSIDDVELALSILAGIDWRDGGLAPVPVTPSHPSDVASARFAVIVGEPGHEATGATVRAIEDAAAAWSGAGMTQVEWNGPPLAEALDITRRYWQRSDRSGAQVDADLRDWDRYRYRYLEAAEHVDLLLSPAVAGTAPLHRRIVDTDYVFTLPASLTGSPALSVPAGPDGDGMPLAVQIAGRPWEDHRVLAAGRVLAA